MTASLAAQALGIVLSAAAAIIGGLVLYNLKQVSLRIQSVEGRQNTIELEQKVLALQPAKCQREFVLAEAWIRDGSYTRAKLDKIAESVAALSGSLKGIEQMPVICGKIASDIVREFKEGGDHA